MKPLVPIAALLLLFGAASAPAAERGVYTIVEGDARVLRGVTWFALVPGARAEDGDIVDAGERAQVQLELARGAALNLQGPALAHASVLPLPGDSIDSPAEIEVQRGWCKAAAPAKARALRLRLANATVDIAGAVVVLHDNSPVTELFVEKGAARIGVPATRSGAASLREATEGEFWRRAADRPLAAAERPPAEFVSAMPRALRDALPALASRYPASPPALVAGRGVSFEEAQPWLTGPSHRTFARRFAPRLSDPAFRAAAAAARPIPEWDRTLHPEKYEPKP